MSNLNIQESLLHSSVSHDPLEIIRICWFVAEETFINISSVQNSCGAYVQLNMSLVNKCISFFFFTDPKLFNSSVIFILFLTHCNYNTEVLINCHLNERKHCGDAKLNYASSLCWQSWIALTWNDHNILIFYAYNKDIVI